MPEKPPPLGPAAGNPESPPGTVTHLEQSLWHRLAEATTAEEFCSSWLGLQSRLIGGVSSGVVLLQDPDRGALTPTAFWPQGAKEAGQVHQVVERALKERKGVVIRNDADRELDSPDDLRYQLAFPVLVGDQVYAVAVLQITPRPQIQLQSAMRQLQWGTAWLQNWSLRRDAAPGAHQRLRLTSALELAAVALEEDRFRPAATAFVTELASRLDCDRVSLGFFDRQQVKIHALSHSAQFGRQMNLIRSIGLAMAESIDQQETLVYPEPDESRHTILQAHEQLARTHGDRGICTVPLLRADGRAFGALTLERAAPRPFDRDTAELCEAVASLVGPILQEKRKNDRLLVAKIGDSLWTQVRRLIGPRHAIRKLVAMVVLGLVLFFSFARGPYRVTAETTLEGKVQRAVVAPYRGFIQEAPARAGDIVQQGDLLCTLDDRDLRLEYSRVSSEREQFLLEHRRAMARNEIAVMQILSKKMQQSDAQIALLDEQIARARITAPFDGVVVSGDLSQSLGSPVETGDILYEVAPLDTYRLMLQVDERDIAKVRPGQRGDLILTALPDDRFSFTVLKITPVSVSEEGRNLFTVEAELDSAADLLRPGMEGFGKIGIDRRRLVWIWTHRMSDWVSLWTWSWWG